MPASTGSTCYAPTANFHRCQLRWHIASCGRSRPFSKPPRRFWKPGRFIINRTPPLSGTCFAHFSLCCCARSWTSDWSPPMLRLNGLTSCAISIASSKSSSINKPSASSYDLRPRAAQAACSKPSASPCRRWCDSCRLLPRHPRRGQSYRSAAAGDRGVVPRRPEFSGFLLPLNDFQIRGVQLEFDIQLTVSEVAVLAVQNNPDLRAVRQQHGVAQAQLLQAGLLPNPQV